MRTSKSRQPEGQVQIINYGSTVNFVSPNNILLDPGIHGPPENMYSFGEK